MTRVPGTSVILRCLEGLGLEEGEPRGGSFNRGIFDHVGRDEGAEPGGRSPRVGGEAKLSLVAALEPGSGEA